MLPKDTLVELKSTGRPYSSRNMSRIGACLHLYYADQPARLETAFDLAGVLLVASRTPTLEGDVKALGLTWEDLGGGYWKLCGGPFTLYVAEIDIVAEAEDDDLLRLFGHVELHILEARRWLYEQVGAKEIHDLEGYDEIIYNDCYESAARAGNLRFQTRAAPRWPAARAGCARSFLTSCSALFPMSISPPSPPPSAP